MYISGHSESTLTQYFRVFTAPIPLLALLELENEQERAKGGGILKSSKKVQGCH